MKKRKIRISGIYCTGAQLSTKKTLKYTSVSVIDRPNRHKARHTFR